jgi:hypothetical protein
MVAVISVSSLVAPGPLSQRDDVDNPLGIEALRGSAAALDSLFVVVFFCVLASLLSVFFRYRRADAVVRQQIKWIAFFGAVVAALYAVTEISRAAGVSEAIMQVLQDVGAIVFASFPLVVGFAILYARLWDIDVVIRKTLVYTALTVLLALVYFGIVVLLQVLFSRLAGVQQSTLAVVLSTLAIAALFTPLRRRIQAIIDRRFYRKKYDAQRVLADFAITARDETDMNALAAELARVVQETMAPETVKVWLRRIPGRGS